MKELNIRGTKYTVDDSEFEKLSKHKWFINGNNYAYTVINNQLWALHELIIGKAPGGFCVNHKDRNKLNNCRTNLEFITRSQNVIGTSLKLGETQERYISFNALRTKFVVRIRRQNKFHCLGSYKTLEKAKSVRDTFLNNL